MKTRCVISAVIALGLVIAMLPANAGEKKGKSPTGFWADSRDDFYHLSSCTRAHKPVGAQLVTGSEMDMIALAYYPDPGCLPNRSIASRAGRLVRVEGAFAGATPKVEGTPSPLPEPPKNDSGFPGLAPGDDKKPGDAKPEDRSAAPTNPFGSAPTEPTKSKTSTGFPAPANLGGFPSPANLGGQPSNPGLPGAGNDKTTSSGAGNERKQTTGTRGGTPGKGGGTGRPSGSGGRPSGGGRTGGGRGGRR